MSASSRVSAFLSAQANDFPELAPQYEAMQKLYSGKLWHQLTDEVDSFVRDSDTTRGENKVQLYEHFVHEFEGRMNQLRFAQILTEICKLHSETPDAIALISATLEKKARLGKEASIFLECALGLFRLGNQNEGDQEAALQIIKEQRPEVESLSADDTTVPSIFYRLSSTYYKLVGPPESFYRDALLFLVFTPTEELPHEEQYTLATDLSLAAITGSGIYNFGEVLATPILSALEGTPNAWLSKMMRVFHDGDIDGFGALMDEHNSAIQEQPAITARIEFVKEKIALLAFMDLIFRKPAHERSIPFKEIADRTRLAYEQVEWLIMRAMSLKLVKGVIDELEGVVEISWLQPRVLEVGQLKQMVSRLDEWTDRVTKTQAFLEEQAPELLQY
uniref:PCI domain-containing protein n=1 Tax=Pinguiococcus pyrenoidosus TaxID=172671 RepID=A0A7R9YAW4_9STRA|mmetsp:Transcript_17167/g.65524  ORF Transcript_17167/g.65524 Transcript_17167/m.65524 type:complete len:390 (+) Transcript_17167:69-1238(+)|eukprot:scaffold10_cov257-Pinguiococcus_pyrenoidosus.AAC.29